MVKSTLKQQTSPNPNSNITADSTPHSHTRHASLSIARSPHLTPSSSAYIPSTLQISPPKSLNTSSRKGSYVPIMGLDRTSEEGAFPHKSRSSTAENGGEERDREELHRDLEAFDLMLDPDGAGDREDNVRYNGPFQPPVGKEMVGILASLVGVLVLAVAAGFTTVYDWVL